MEAAALEVADLDSFPLEPATSVQKSKKLEVVCRVGH